jgi:hypothetical protein
MESADFEAALAAHPEGYSEVLYEGRRYGVSFRRSDDERRNSLFARESAGTDIATGRGYRWQAPEPHVVGPPYGTAGSGWRCG